MSAVRYATYDSSSRSLGDNLVDPELDQKLGKPRDAAPRPKRRTLVVHDPLGPPMLLDGVLEALDHHTGALGIIDAVADHVA